MLRRAGVAAIVMCGSPGAVPAAQPARPPVASSPLAARPPTAIPFDGGARAGLPRGHAVREIHGATVDCEGVWLGDLLARAGVPAGEALRGRALALAVAADAADGYRIVFTLAELDAGLGRARVLIADACGGAPIAAADGPLRLIVPGDARAARSLRQLRALTLIDLAP